MNLRGGCHSSWAGARGIPAAVRRLAQVERKGGFEPTRRESRHLQAPGVQQRPPRVERRRQRGFAHGAMAGSAVEIVAHHRMPRRREMDAQLVRAPGARPERHQRDVSRRREHLPIGHRRPPRGHRRASAAGPAGRGRADSRSALRAAAGGPRPEPRRAWSPPAARSSRRARGGCRRRARSAPGRWSKDRGGAPGGARAPRAARARRQAARRPGARPPPRALAAVSRATGRPACRGRRSGRRGGRGEPARSSVAQSEHEVGETGRGEQPARRPDLAPAAGGEPRQRRRDQPGREPVGDVVGEQRERDRRERRNRLDQVAELDRRAPSAASGCRPPPAPARRRTASPAACARPARRRAWRRTAPR